MDVDDRVGREILRDADDLVRAGDLPGAVERYDRYCDHLEQQRLYDGASTNLRQTAVRRQILELIPERRDVRRKLAEDYVNLDLRAEAIAEFRRLASEYERLGDDAAQAETFARLRELDG